MLPAKPFDAGQTISSPEDHPGHLRNWVPFACRGPRRRPSIRAAVIRSYPTSGPRSTGSTCPPTWHV